MSKFISVEVCHRLLDLALNISNDPKLLARLRHIYFRALNFLKNFKTILRHLDNVVFDGLSDFTGLGNLRKQGSAAALAVRGLLRGFLNLAA